LSRLILFLLIAYVIYSLLKSYVAGRKIKPRHPEERTGDEEEMVFDPQCQSYLPKKDAISQGGKFFCSEECAKLYLSR
jgi:uncharacterized protein